MSDAIETRIVKIPDTPSYLRALIYGPSGSGKTTLAASYPADRILFANIEDGYLPLVGTGISMVNIRSYRDLQSLYDYLKRGQHGYDMVWIDSFSEAKRFMSAEVATSKRSSTKNPYQLSEDDYRQANEMLRRWVWDMRSLPMHVVFVAIDATLRRKGELVTTRIPDLGEALANSLYAYCDIVGYLELIQSERPGTVPGEPGAKVVQQRLWLTGTEDFVAKARIPVAWKGVRVPEFIINPTLGKLLALYKPKTKEEPA